MYCNRIHNIGKLISCIFLRDNKETYTIWCFFLFLTGQQFQYLVKFLRCQTIC